MRLSGSVDADMPSAGWHRALLYDNPEQYTNGVLRFIDDALAESRPVFVVVPVSQGERLRAKMNGKAAEIRFADMAEVGRNPSRIIPAIQGFINEHLGQPISFVGEPIWPGRNAAEVAEATRHEALINAAGFHSSGARVLCPYDVSGLGPTIIADAYRTHQELQKGDGTRHVSDHYTEPHQVWNDTGFLPPPPTTAEHIIVTQETFSSLRPSTRAFAETVALPEARLDNLLLSVTELVTNSLFHGGRTAEVTMWAEHGNVLCDVHDTGVITNPLAGRSQPLMDTVSGRGLWLVNQLCDLVQLHSSADGTHIRITV